MDEQQRPSNPYRRTPPAQAGQAPRTGQGPQSVPPTGPGAPQGRAVPTGQPVPQGYPAYQAYPAPQPARGPQPMPAPVPQPMPPAYPATASRTGQTPQTTSTVLLWIGVIFGFLGVLSGAVLLPDSVFSGIGMILLAACLILPCAWPLRCRSRDRKTLAVWEKEQATNRELVSFLTEEDAYLTESLAPTPPPARSPRHWTPVWITVAVMLVLSMVCIGLGDDALTESNEQYSSGTGTQR